MFSKNSFTLKIKIELGIDEIYRSLMLQYIKILNKGKIYYFIWKNRG